MDIRKQANQPEENQPKKQSKQKESGSTFKTGLHKTADAKAMLPPGVQAILAAQTQKYGIPFDLSNIALDGTMADKVKTLRKIVDTVQGDKQLLGEMFKLIKRLLKAEIKLAQFYKLLTKETVKHQQKLDKETADIFLTMAGYQAKSKKLEHRTNVRNQLKEKRTEAYTNHYENSVYGDESKIIDVEFEVLESNRKILTESKTQKIEFNAERKKKLQEYVNSAYQN